MTNRRTLSSKRSGHTLLEVMLASFLALACALIFAATVPVANFTRGKAENLSTAISLAQKTAEQIKVSGYPNVTGTQLLAKGLIDSTTKEDISSLPFGLTGEQAYPAKDVDNGVTDSPSKLLPEGRAYIMTDQVDLDLRRVTVVVCWKERSNWKSTRLSTLVANL